MSDDAKDAYLEGLKLYGEDRFQEAIEAFDRGLAQKPEWVDLLQAKGMAQMNAGDTAKALETLINLIDEPAAKDRAMRKLRLLETRLGVTGGASPLSRDFQYRTKIVAAMRDSKTVK